MRNVVLLSEYLGFRIWDMYTKEGVDERVVQKRQQCLEPSVFTTPFFMTNSQGLYLQNPVKLTLLFFHNY
jgi:hypothetical protein